MVIALEWDFVGYIPMKLYPPNLEREFMGINTFYMVTFIELLQFDNDNIFVCFLWRITKSFTKIQTCVIHSRIRHFYVTEESRGVHDRLL